VFSGASGELLFRFRTGESDDGFGYSVAGAGDVDGDGQADLLVGAPFARRGELRNAGAALVHAGSGGAVLHTVRGEAEGDSLGWSVTGTGDLDGDGRADFAVGVPYRRHRRLADCGAVLVVSGKTGKTLRELRGERACERFGWSLADVLDVNGDRAHDLLVGAEGDMRAQRVSGCARAFSGRSGVRIVELRGNARDGTVADEYQGTAVAAGGDFDGDGRRDLLVGAFRGRNDDGARSGCLFGFGAIDGRTLLVAGGRGEHDRFGHALAVVGDLDGDGADDVAAGAPQQLGARGYVRVVSGRTGEVLHELAGEVENGSFGASLAWLGDGQVAIGAPGAGSGGQVVVVRLEPKPAKK
jgi:hypothetical protein